MDSILVTGGAGYIGSHTVKGLTAGGFRVLVLDDLSEGHRGAVLAAELVEADCGDPEVLDRLLGAGGVAAIVHFAARCYVGESVQAPARYYDRNVRVSLALLDAAVRHGVGVVVFSSSCAVYGDSGGEDLDESRLRDPANPYGRTKVAVEWALEDYARAYGIRFAALRYFNAAGADPEGELGEDHRPETHLVPLAVREALRGEGALTVFGGDYPTPDGTCIRDYVHVTDLAAAHVAALRHLLDGGASEALNLGTGEGASVLEVIREVEACSGRRVGYRLAGRRAGDPPRLVARSGRAREVLGWRPRHSRLGEIVETAWRWQVEHPEGYA